MSQITHDSLYVAGGHQSIGVAGTPVSLATSYAALIQPTTGTFAKKSATAVDITPIDGGLYYTLDGTAPAVDGSAGHLCKAGDTLRIKGWWNIQGLKMIQQGSTAVSNVNITPYFTETGIA